MPEKLGNLQAGLFHFHIPEVLGDSPRQNSRHADAARRRIYQGGRATEPPMGGGKGTTMPMGSIAAPPEVHSGYLPRYMVGTSRGGHRVPRKLIMSMA